MLIFFKERLAYLAVPKTGTTAIERALHRRASAVFRDPPGIKHTNAKGYERKFRSIFERPNLTPIETIAVMREPVSWLGSWYRYRQRPALSGHKNSTADVSFDSFVEAYLSDTQPDFAKVGAQSRFLCNEAGQVLVNHLFIYEAPRQLLSFLETRLGESLSTEQVNVSPKKELRLSHNLLEELQTQYAKDFELYAQLSKHL